MEKEITPTDSAFNEASFKMRRLDKIQDLCNTYRKSPRNRDEETQLPNFKLHCDSVVSLYLEISSKLTKEEKAIIKPMLEELKKVVKKIADLCLPNTILDRTEEITKDLETIDKGLFDCEELIREYLDKHGFATLNAENLEGDSYN